MVNLNQVLVISAIGMGLVFLSILLMWAMMELLVKIFADKPLQTTLKNEEESFETISSSPDIKKQAAAIAVAVALAQNRKINQPKLSTQTPQTVQQVSAWQSVMRATEREKQIQFHFQKPRGKV
ncbi:MAG: hypothetical protein JEZ06_02625 [Anaerolineaceae bacterium]|nr:hypothetical protein [Anaerolineaceae bacterium]